MKLNLPVNNQETVFSESQRIVSSTTDKGVITFVNDDFVDISGFNRDELLGQAHNIVRHPDMPQAAFKNLWDTANANKPWMGMVKNRCKNGDYYWVDAFVTPTITDNKITGFQSVRLKPDPALTKRADNIYQSINKGHSWLSKLSNIPFSLQTKISVAGIFSITIGFMTGKLFGLSFDTGISAMIIATIGSLLLLAGLISRPWHKAAADTLEIFDNPLARHIYTGRNDELGQLQLAIQFLKAQQNTIIWRTSEEVKHLETAATAASNVTVETEKNMNALHNEVDMVATALEEMTATVQEVAESTVRTSTSTQHTYDQVNSGKSSVLETKQIVEALATNIETSARIIQNLAEDSEQIGSVVDVIRGVAEQTNLLALNAAIEAARAGEMGRGFAVVADEVRGLAGKTQSSTEEINNMIVSLQNAAKDAVNSMNESSSTVAKCLNNADQATNTFTEIIENMNTINDMSTQIATAAEEQTLVCAEINRNILNINSSTANTLEGSQSIKNANADLVKSAQKLSAMIVQFGD